MRSLTENKWNRTIKPSFVLLNISLFLPLTMPTTFTFSREFKVKTDWLTSPVFCCCCLYLLSAPQPKQEHWKHIGGFAGLLTSKRKTSDNQLLWRSGFPLWKGRLLTWIPRQCMSQYATVLGTHLFWLQSLNLSCAVLQGSSQTLYTYLKHKNVWVCSESWDILRLHLRHHFSSSFPKYVELCKNKSNSIMKKYFCPLNVKFDTFNLWP